MRSTSCAKRLFWSWIDVFHRFCPELAHDAGVVTDEREHACERSETNRGDEDQREDDVWHRTEERQDATCHLEGEGIRSGRASRKDSKQERERHRKGRTQETDPERRQCPFDALQQGF